MASGILLALIASVIFAATYAYLAKKNSSALLRRRDYEGRGALYLGQPLAVLFMILGSDVWSHAHGRGVWWLAWLACLMITITPAVIIQQVHNRRVKRARVTSAGR